MRGLGNTVVGHEFRIKRKSHTSALPPDSRHSRRDAPLGELSVGPATRQGGSRRTSRRCRSCLLRREQRETFVLRNKLRPLCSASLLAAEGEIRRRATRVSTLCLSARSSGRSGGGMQRREFLTFLAAATAAGRVAWPSALHAQDQASSKQGAGDQIGQVATLQGSATVTRGNPAAAAGLRVNDFIFKNDMLELRRTPRLVSPSTTKPPSA